MALGVKWHGVARQSSECILYKAFNIWCVVDIIVYLSQNLPSCSRILTFMVCVFSHVLGPLSSLNIFAEA